MSFLTERQLRSKLYTKSITESKNIVTNQRNAQRTIFLSHSHKDKDLILGFIAILDEYGIKLYVDWQDSDMPKVTSRETAEKIKKKIRELDYFLILATKSALASLWVPWEVGIADVAKAHSQIAIIPVADESGRFEGNEYLQIYQTIELNDKGGLGVFLPGENRGYSLKHLLSQEP